MVANTAWLLNRVEVRLVPTPGVTGLPPAHEAAPSLNDACTPGTGRVRTRPTKSVSVVPSCSTAHHHTASGSSPVAASCTTPCADGGTGPKNVGEVRLGLSATTSRQSSPVSTLATTRNPDAVGAPAQALTTLTATPPGSRGHSSGS